MNLKVANINDLNNEKNMFQNIIQYMNSQGISIKILDQAISLARQMKMEYLRLFVVDSHLPAIALYKKLG